MTSEEIYSKLYHYKAKITNVIDGDTVDAVVDYGFHGSIKVRFRIYQDSGFYFDTPEIRKYKGVSEEHKEHGIEAKKRAEELLLNKEVIIHTHKEGSFRWLGDIYLLDGINYAQKMIDEGFQKKQNY